MGVIVWASTVLRKRKKGNMIWNWRGSENGLPIIVKRICAIYWKNWKSYRASCVWCISATTDSSDNMVIAPIFITESDIEIPFWIGCAIIWFFVVCIAVMMWKMK